MEKRRTKRKHNERRDEKERKSKREMSSRKKSSRAKDSRNVKKPIKQVTRRKSDAPTVAIAPSDYAHIFHAGAEALTPNVPKKTGETLARKSDAPTVAIAPSDYEHIYRNPEVVTPNVPKKVAPSPLTRKKSDAPTVAIAPSDYEHIFSLKKEGQAPKQFAGPSPLTRKKSDAPTVAIAPSDYEHIYRNPEVVTPNVPKKIAPSPLTRKKSDAPTVAIAPSDYEHIFSLKKEGQVPSPKQFAAPSPLTRKKSDAPTVAIAPSDYEHIYRNPEVVTPNVPSPAVPKKPTLAALERKKSDAPTVAIAPSDYEHIYRNPEVVTPSVPKKDYQYREEQTAPAVPKKPTLAALERKKSDAPTVAIAPSDYEHIWRNPEVNAPPKRDAQPEPVYQVPAPPKIEESRKEVKKPVSTGNVQAQPETSTKYLPMKPQYGEEPKKSVSKTRPFKVILTERKATQTQVTQPEETSYSEKQSPVAPVAYAQPEELAAQPPAYAEKPIVKEESKKIAPNTAYRDGISEQVKDIVKKFSFNRPREYTIKSRIPKPKKE